MTASAKTPPEYAWMYGIDALEYLRNRPDAWAKMIAGSAAPGRICISKTRFG